MTPDNNVRLGIAGQLTKAFITSPLTPLFLFAALVVGLVTHRNERRRAAQLEAEVTRRTREVEEARAFLQVVVDTTPAALLVLDRDRRDRPRGSRARPVSGLVVARL